MFRLRTLPPVVIIFALAFAVRVAFIFLAGLDRQPLNFGEVDRVAESIISRHVFGNPYALPTGPTAHLAPVYTWLVSLLFRLFGSESLRTVSVLTFNAACASGQYALLVVFARVCRLSRRVGILAGGVGALVPLRPLVETRGWETSLTAFGLVAVLTLTMVWWRRHPVSAWYSALAGFCWGVLLLEAPQMLLVFAAMLAIYVFVVPNSTFLQAAIAILSVSLAILPWTVRNVRTFGHLFYIRSNFGLELSMSNHDGAGPVYMQEFGAVGAHNFFQQRHPGMNPQEARLVQQMGEINYHHARLREALQWIENHPREFARLTALRIFYFWFMPSFPWYKDFILFPLVIVGMIGLVRLFWVEPLAAWLLTACWVAFPPVYYFIFLDSRYRYPLDWTFLFLASFLFFELQKTAFVGRPTLSSIKPHHSR